MKPVYLKYVVSCVLVVLTGWFIGAAQADSTASLLAQGYQQWSSGHLDQAQHTYERAIKADPRSVEPRMKLAGLYMTRKDYSAATTQYQRAIGLDPKNAKAWMGLGIAYLHNGDKSMTRAAWEEALRLEPARKQQLAPLLAKLDTPSP